MAANDFNSGFGLPLEYQSEVEALARRRAIAQALQAQTMQPIQVQQMGRMASKLPVGAVLGRALAGYMAGQNSESASQEMQGLAQKAQGEAQTELGGLTRMGDKQAQIAAALVSRFPGIRQQGQLWQKDLSETVREGAKGVMPEDPSAGIRMLNSGRLDPNYARPPIPAPTFGTTPDTTASPYALTTNRKGEQNLTFAPRPSNTTLNAEVRLPGKEGEYALERESKELSARQTQAQTAMAELATSQRLTQLYEQGLRTGGGESAFQLGRKVAQAFGVEIPATGITDSARTLLGERLLDRAKDLGANPSNADRDAIKSIVGTIDTDPNAVGRLIAWTTAKSLKALQDFQDFTAIKRKNARVDGLYDSADVGIRMPEQLFGPQLLQYQMLEALKQEGGDISRFRDSAGPISPDATFRFGPGAAIPGPARPQMPDGIKPLGRRRG